MFSIKIKSPPYHFDPKTSLNIKKKCEIVIVHSQIDQESQINRNTSTKTLKFHENKMYRNTIRP